MTMPDVRSIIAIILVFGAHALIGALIYLKADPALLNTAIGFYLGVFSAVGTYYFGSSSGSKEKDDVIGKIASNAPVKANGN